MFYNPVSSNVGSSSQELVEKLAAVQRPTNTFSASASFITSVPDDTKTTKRLGVVNGLGLYDMSHDISWTTPLSDTSVYMSVIHFRMPFRDCHLSK